MPIYNFQCQDCNHIQEELLSSTELKENKISCEKCGSTKTTRIISRPNGFVKGTQTPTRS